MVYKIGMFSLGFPEVLPPTIIMTLHIRSIPYIYPFAPYDYSVPYSNCVAGLVGRPGRFGRAGGRRASRERAEGP